MKKNLTPKKHSLPLLVSLALLLLLLLPSSSMAMNSANFRLDWFAPMTGVGGASNSPNYAMNLTIGQTVAGQGASAGYAVNLGFWQKWSAPAQYLPVVVRP